MEIIVSEAGLLVNGKALIYISYDRQACEGNNKICP